MEHEIHVARSYDTLERERSVQDQALQFAGIIVLVSHGRTPKTKNGWWQKGWHYMLQAASRYFIYNEKNSCSWFIWRFWYFILCPILPTVGHIRQVCLNIYRIRHWFGWERGLTTHLFSVMHNQKINKRCDRAIYSCTTSFPQEYQELYIHAKISRTPYRGLFAILCLLNSFIF